MAIDFEFYQNPDPSGEENGKYHVRPVTHQTVQTDEICKNIQYACSLTEGDVKAVLSALRAEILFNVKNSNRVHLEGIGYFEAGLKVTREIEPDKTRSQSVYCDSLNFRADKLMKQHLLQLPTARAEFKKHSPQMSDKAVDKKVSEYLKEHSAITRRDLQRICGFTPYLAHKHIHRLVEENKIRNINTRHQPVFVLNNE